MKQGFIKLHRSILDWEWYDDPNTMRLFLHLLLNVNHKEKKWRGITIKKGQKLTSQIKLSEETGLTRQQVRTSLKKLTSTNEVTMLSNAQHTVITVTNWDSYQDQPAKQPTGNQPVTNEQPTDNQRVTTNKNDKNVNNDKNEKNNNGEFDLVWSMYEKKGNKKTSQERFNKMTDANKQLMAKHLPEYVKTTPDLQYRKNLEVYINKECWNDEILNKSQASEFSAITQKNIQNLQGEW